MRGAMCCADGGDLLRLLQRREFGLGGVQIVWV